MNEIDKPTTFKVLDFDRTLLDTNRTMEYFHHTVAGFDRSLADDMVQAQATVEQQNRSFDAHGFVSDELQPDALERLEDNFVATTKTVDLLFPSARGLLHYMQWRKDAFGIMTRGSDAWQTLKLRASRLDSIPHKVIQNLSKVQEIASWQQPSGEFLVPTELRLGEAIGKHALFTTVALVDDKVQEVEGLSDIGGRGYWYHPINNDIPLTIHESGTIEIRHLYLFADHEDMIQARQTDRT